MGENILKIGLIGTGAIGRTHFKRINQKLQGGKVIAVSDVNKEFGRSIAEQLDCAFYETGEELINAPEIDAVVVTTSDQYHEQFVMAAIKAGKPVFCEKPLAPQADGAKRIVDAEVAGGKHLVQVGFMRRYDAGYRQMKEALDNRVLGEPLMLHCAHRNETVDESYDTPMAVENSMIHEIDVLRWLLNEDYKTASVVFPKKTRNAHENLQDPQIMFLTTESGVHIDVEAFVCCGYGYEIKCEVVCEDGVMNMPEAPYLQVRTDGKRYSNITTDWSQRFGDAYDTEFQEWINATKEGRVDGPTAWDGYVGQVTASAASKARDTQTTVTIELEERPNFYK
ncbi:MAG: Gfo/Idh/MocA family protein [Fastidiosipilaceae bacterium]|jgi:myo-inositol 2-dehydrogenase/D-chiro-inositol 1-dehydrogenase